MEYLGFFDYKESDTFRSTIDSRVHLNRPTSKTICANGIPAIIEGGGYKIGENMLRGGKQVNETIEKNIDKFKDGKVLNMDLYNRSVNEEISQTLTEPNHNSQRLFDGLRIRKLTPKECWRLMGFDDEDFEKAEKVNSNTQLYKQAGNSIVVNVLERILENLVDKNEHIRILELFGGIGACSKALERLGIDYEIADYVEIDKYAVASFNAMHNTNFEPQDITTWDKDIECDLIMHGSPCQDFSLAGRQAGGDEGSGTRSSLMYETVRIVEKSKPKYVIWENVKNVISKKHKHNFDNYIERMKELGYTSYYQVLNAKDYGIPQNRERVFTISIRDDVDDGLFAFPTKQELKLKLKDMLEDKVDEKYYLNSEHIGRICKWKSYQNPLEKVFGENSVMATITTRVAESDGGGVSASAKFIGDGLKDTINLRNEIINVGNVNPSGKGLNGKAVDSEGLARTITIEKGEGQKILVDDSSILVKNATKKGYLDAYEGDGVDISSRMQYHRGNVQPQSIQTITTSGGNDRGVVVSDKINVIGNYSPSGHDASRIVDKECIAPTVKENHGTVTAIVEDDYDFSDLD